MAADPPWVTDGPNNKAEFYRLIEAAGLDRLLIRPYEICTGADAIRTAFSRVFTEFGAVAVKLPGRASGDGILVTSGAGVPSIATDIPTAVTKRFVQKGIKGAYEQCLTFFIQGEPIL